MKQSKFKQQLQSSTNREMESLLAEERKNLYGLRQQIAMKQLNNPLAIRESRKKIARMLTTLRERELKEAGEQAKA
ncbi:MAG: 50S ribosomal protein L29 [Armatimonadota bacterium]